MWTYHNLFALYDMNIISIVSSFYSQYGIYLNSWYAEIMRWYINYPEKSKKIILQEHCETSFVRVFSNMCQNDQFSLIKFQFWTVIPTHKLNIFTFHLLPLYMLLLMLGHFTQFFLTYSLEEKKKSDLRTCSVIQPNGIRRRNLRP